MGHTVKLEQYVFRAIINHSFFRGLYVIVWIHHNGINEILLLFGVCGYLKPKGHSELSSALWYPGWVESLFLSVDIRLNTKHFSSLCYKSVIKGLNLLSILLRAIWDINLITSIIWNSDFPQDRCCYHPFSFSDGNDPAQRADALSFHLLFNQ